jgi:hypothetical protein
MHSRFEFKGANTIQFPEGLLWRDGLFDCCLLQEHF